MITSQQQQQQQYGKAVLPYSRPGTAQLKAGQRKKIQSVPAKIEQL